MNMFKMCFNPKVIAGLLAVAAGVYVFAPEAFAAALPLLFLAACPLSMVLMMKMMTGDSGDRGREEPNPQPAAATTGIQADADALRAELERLRVQQTFVADQLAAVRRDETNQV